jgi:hypothetical protein
MIFLLFVILVSTQSSPAPSSQPTSQPSSQASSLDVCGVGRYKSEQGKCVRCPAGFVNPQAGALSVDWCDLCPWNYYPDEEGGECRPCPLLTYTNRIAMSASDCTPCPEEPNIKHYALEVSAPVAYWKFVESGNPTHVCDGHALFRWSDAQWRQYDHRHKCPPGTHYNFYAPSEQKCVPCPVGNYKADGYYLSHDMEHSCRPCPPGTHAPFEGMSKCLKCRPGYFSSQPENEEAWQPIEHCEACRAGTYSLNGFSACDLCPPGTFQPGVSEGCHECLYNTYSDTWGAPICKLCPVGKSANTLASQYCYDIPLEELSQYERSIIHSRSNRRLETTA